MAVRKLMNIDEDVPSEFFIFVNELNPMTQHNFHLIGKFFSAAFASLDLPGILPKYQNGSLRYLPYEPCKSDEMALSPYFLSAINDYRIEYDIEVYREKHYPFFPSRLSAIYAFASMDACLEVNRRYGWPLETVQRFKLIDHPLNRVVKVNMEHVSLARHAYKVTHLEETDRLWQGYWSGAGNIAVQLPTPGFARKTYESVEIWEYLIEGVVEHIDREPNTSFQPTAHGGD